MNLVLSNAHVERLRRYYNLNFDHPAIVDMLRCGWLRSVTRTEAEELLGLKPDTLETGGLLIRYPNAPETFTIRLDEPYIGPDGRERKYMRPVGQANRLFVPPGVSLDSRELMLTEGELKSLAAVTHGLHCVAVAGVWNWRSRDGRPDFDDPPDSEALITDLKRDWTNAKFVLIYDSDIDARHEAYPAFQRLAEQLYACGALSVKILTLPKLDGATKVGLDDFLRLRSAAGGDPVAELRTLVERTATYMPVGDGAEAFATQRIAAWPADPDALLQATTALLAAKGEVYVQKWLKERVRDRDLRKTALKEAKEKLPKHVAPKPTPKASNKLFGDILSRYAGTGYTVNAAGELCYMRATQFGEELVPLANFVPYLTQQIVKDNGAETVVVVEIAGRLANGRDLLPVRMPVAKLASATWSTEAWGAEANPLPGVAVKDRLRHAVLSTAHAAEKRTVFAHLGWRKIGEEWVFLHGGGALGAENVMVEPDVPELARFVLPSGEPDPEQVKRAVRCSLDLLETADRRVTSALWCGVYRAPTASFLYPTVSIYPYGPSSAGKSTLTALFASHFGSFTHDTLPASWLSSENYLEYLLFLARDVMMVIDDIPPQLRLKHARALEATVARIVRAVGNRQARGRLKSDITGRPGYLPYALVVATAEYLTASITSEVTRTFPLRFDFSTLNWEKVTAAQRQSEVLPVAMAGYLLWLRPQLDELGGWLQERFEELRDKAGLEIYRRVSANVAHLMLGAHLGLAFAADCGAITEAQADRYEVEIWDALKETAAGLVKLAREERPTRKFLQVLQALFLQGVAHLRDRQTGGPPVDAMDFGWRGETPGGPLVGWVDDYAFYLLPEAAFKAVNDFLKPAGLPLREHALREALAAEGLLQRDTDGRLTQKPRCEGRPQRVLVLPRERVVAEWEEVHF